ncbi:MAG: glycosyltransferase family 4 protein, partial [Candidatus Sumerlaeota bacterium]
EHVAPSLGVRAAEFFREQATRNHLSTIVVPTMRAKKALLGRGIPEEKIARIAPGVNAVEAYPLPDHKRDRYRMLMGIAHDAPLVVSVCPLEDAAIGELIAAMQEIVSRIPSAKLFIFGDGAARESALKKVADAGLAESVILIGAMTSILSKIFSSADVSIHTCAGGSSYALVAEAQACATPVVAYRTGCLDELILDGETGVLVERGDRAKLADNVVTLLKNRELRKKIGANARTFILEHHEVTNSAEEYVKLWQSAAPEADWMTTTGSISHEELKEIKDEALSGLRTPLPVKRGIDGGRNSGGEKL